MIRYVIKQFLEESVIQPTKFPEGKVKASFYSGLSMLILQRSFNRSCRLISAGVLHTLHMKYGSDAANKEFISS